jgi:hypothetical protein
VRDTTQSRRPRDEEGYEVSTTPEFGMSALILVFRFGARICSGFRDPLTCIFSLPLCTLLFPLCKFIVSMIVLSYVLGVVQMCMIIIDHCYTLLFELTRHYPYLVIALLLSPMILCGIYHLTSEVYTT